MEEKKENKREEFTIKVGKGLIDVLKKQIQKVNEATYNCVNASYFEAGEILAKKIVSAKLI